MRYRNVITGAIIDVPSEIKGGKWEKIDGGKAEKPAAVVISEEVEIEKPVKKTRRSKK